MTILSPNKKSLEKSLISSTINQKYKNVINQILLNENNEIISRKLKVKEKLFTTMDFNPYLSIPSFEARPFNFKYFLGELAWYLRKDNHANFISNFSSFWKKLKNPNGTINSNYGKLILNDQMNWVVNTLKIDKYSRQAIVYLGNRKMHQPKNRDFICTQYINFFIRNNQLHMKVQMRSNDLIYGVTYDAPFFALIHQTIYLNLLSKYKDLEIGNYYHCSDNTHFYEKHENVINKIVKDDNNEIYKMELKEPLFYTKKLLKSTKIDYSDATEKFLGMVEIACENKEYVKNLTYNDSIGILNSIIDIQKLDKSKLK